MRYFIEWQSGRTETVDVDESGSVRLENGSLVQWPLAWPNAVLSAVELRSPNYEVHYINMLAQMAAGIPRSQNDALSSLFGGV